MVGGLQVGHLQKNRPKSAETVVPSRTLNFTWRSPYPRRIMTRQSHRRSRMNLNRLTQFSLRSLLIWGVVVSVCVATSVNSDWIAGVMLFGASVLVDGALRLPRVRFHWPLRMV